MADASKQKMRRDVRAAQVTFERDLDATREARSKAFSKAHEAGLSLREIGDEVGLHHTRVRQIIRGE